MDQARGKISPRHQEALRASFLLARELTRVYRPELEAAARTRAAVKEAQAHLATIDARRLCENLGMDWVAYKANKGLYSPDPAVTSMDRNLALPYALKLVEDIEKRMHYPAASVFGYY